MKYTFIVLITIILHFDSNAQQKITIVPLKILNKVFVDTATNPGKRLIHKFDCYLIKGYHNTKKNSRYIDRFAQSHKDLGIKKYFDYHIIFYKKSQKTNIKAIRDSIKATKHFTDNEEDLVFDYNWLNYGKEFERHKLDSAKVNSSNSKVMIKPVPIPADSTHN